MSHMQHDQPSREDVLLLLLQHKDCLRISREDTTTLKLLATSNAMQAAVSAHCKGRIALSFGSYTRTSTYSYSDPFKEQRAKEESFRDWLSKHLHLLKALHIEDFTMYDLGFSEKPQEDDNLFSTDHPGLQTLCGRHLSREKTQHSTRETPAKFCSCAESEWAHFSVAANFDNFLLIIHPAHRSPRAANRSPTPNLPSCGPYAPAQACFLDFAWELLFSS